MKNFYKASYGTWSGSIHINDDDFLKDYPNHDEFEVEFKNDPSFIFDEHTHSIWGKIFEVVVERDFLAKDKTVEPVTVKVKILSEEDDCPFGADDYLEGGVYGRDLM